MHLREGCLLGLEFAFTQVVDLGVLFPPLFPELVFGGESMEVVLDEFLEDCPIWDLGVVA